MHIVLDFNPVLRTQYSGFYTYGTNLLSALLRTDEVSQLTLLCNRTLLPNLKSLPATNDSRVRTAGLFPKLRRWERWWRYIPFPKLERMIGPYDIYHSVHHLMPPASMPRVITVHDLRRYRLPNLYPNSKTTLFERSVRSADRIMAISNSTKQDLVELLNIDPGHIDVTHLGTPNALSPLPCDQIQEVRKEISQRMEQPIDGYVVALSSKDRRKNIDRTIQAFKLASERLEENIGLVIMGHLPQNTSAFESQSQANGNILTVGPVDDARFARYLAAADALLFMSLYEGFGLPILEAMASGVPVIGSHSSSIPEVIGDAGLLADPQDIQAIADRIITMFSNTRIRQDCIRAGRARANEWSWDRTASCTIDCYKKAFA